MANNVTTNPLVLDTTTSTTITMPFPIKVIATELIVGTTTGTASVFEAISGLTMVAQSNPTANTTVVGSYAQPIKLSTKVSGITCSIPTGAKLLVYYN